MHANLLYQQGTRGDSLSFFITLAVGVIFWVAMMSWGQKIAKRKGYPIAVGGCLGLLLGPIGVLIVALLPRKAVAAKATPPPEPGSDERRCPHCAEIIRVEAKVCKHCGRDV